MYLDSQTLFSDAQTVTTNSDTGVPSTSWIDLGAASTQDFGTGEGLYVVVAVDTAMTDSSSNSTLLCYLATDDNSSGTSPTNVQLIGTFPATSAAGVTLIAKVQPAVLGERYLGVNYITGSGTGALSAGVFTAFLTNNIEKYTAYPDAVTITT
jgi:hypothetical protein